MVKEKQRIAIEGEKALLVHWREGRISIIDFTHGKIDSAFCAFSTDEASPILPRIIRDSQPLRDLASLCKRFG
jgi:hypothetical protein